MYNKQEPWSKVSLLKGRKKLCPSYGLVLPTKYPNGHPIKQKKKQDLQNMVPFLPVEHRLFYLDLKSTSSDSDSE